jgi:hypothetical protein
MLKVCDELTKVSKSEENLASAEEIYKPKLAWFTKDYAFLMLLQPETRHITL